MSLGDRLSSLIHAWPDRAGDRVPTRLPNVASLFGKRKLKDLASEISTDEIADKLDIVRRWHEDYHHGTLKTDTETSREQAYNQEVQSTR